MKKKMKFILTLLCSCFILTSTSCTDIIDYLNNLNDPNSGSDSSNDDPLPAENQLEYILNNEETGWIVKGIGTCTDRNLSIPETYEDKNVIGIEESAFVAASLLTSVHISKHIESIGENAFSRCINLTSITVAEENAWFSTQSDILYNKEKTQLIVAPEMVAGEIIIPGTLGVVKSGSYSHLYNTSSFVVSEGITTIEDKAFEYSTAISHVVFPKSLKNIGINLFTMCQAMDAIYYRGTQQEWNKIKQGSTLEDKPVYYYIEEEPTQEGKYWHEVNGKPTKW